MFTLFSRIILSNWRSLIVLCVTILFASTGFVTLRQITTNIESSVASETRPLFGADLIVSPRGYASGDILPMIAPYLSGEVFQVAERREFSTTLLDQSGKPALVQVVSYSGSYPQRGILKTDILLQKEGANRIAVTPGLIDRFASGGVIPLDGRRLEITEKILESSDLGFSLGTENHLIVLPSSLLSGSMLLSSGSRLDHDLMISFDDEARAKIIAAKLREVLDETLYRVRTYEDRTERNLETVETLTDYITLILLVSSIFAFVIIRSAHERFYDHIARTLRVTEMLGLTRRRQQILLLLLYGIIFPGAFAGSIGLSILLIEMIRTIPEASDFSFFFSILPEAGLFLLLLVVLAWFPIWWTLGGSDEQGESVSFSRERLLGYFLDHENGGRLHIKNIAHKLKILIPQYVIQIVSLILSFFLLLILFGDIFFSLSVALGAGIFFLVFSVTIRFVYRVIFSRVSSLRQSRFYIFDGIRALVRPLTPTLPITLSLVSVTVFFLVFASFSLAFRSKLVIDSTNTANIYAINILESDRSRIESVIGSGALMYDILRARILEVNGQSLAQYLGEERPSGEFTREFNITTTPLENAILRGKSVITRGEVSVDDEFAGRLGISIGDTVTFLLSGREVTLRVANIRESIREGFRPFFYFSFDPEEFKNAPRTYFVAEYTPDVEKWKRDILTASGPHVTFIDIESILAIVRDISSKVLSVIQLFAIVVFLFALGAIFAFFTRMKPVEEMKSRLYDLFGATPREIGISLGSTRLMIFIVSYILSILIGGVLSYSILSIGGFFVFSFSNFILITLVTGVVYGGMIGVMRR